MKAKPIPFDKMPVLVKRIFMAALASLLMSSCASVAPILTSAAIKFGQDLLSVASHNVSPQYSSDIEQLLVALLREEVGIKIPYRQDNRYGDGRQTQDQYGYGSNTQGQQGYGSNTQGQQGYGSNTQDQYGYGSNTQGQQGYGSNSQDQYGYGGNTQGQQGYGSNTQDQYGYGSNTQGQQGYGNTQDQYGYGSNTEGQQGYGSNTQDQYGYGSNTQGQQGYGSNTQDQYGYGSNTQGQQGYGSNSQDQYGYGGNTQGQQGYGSNTQDQYGYGSNTQGQQGYGSNSQDQYGYGGNTQGQQGYGSNTQDQYGYGSNTQGQQGYGNTQDQYGYGSNPQGQQGYGSNPQGQQGYGGNSQDQYGYGSNAQDQYAYTDNTQGSNYSGYRGNQAPLSMDIGLLAQRTLPDGRVTTEAIQDGAVLHDGRGNPEAGDKLKISFKTNCNCYVYIIGIDATGYVAQIFPDPDSTIGNPVSADRQYTFPEGDIWWGLDDYRGVETVYFIASHTRRADIEDIVSKLARTDRRVPKDYQSVQVAAVIPQTRGMVKVQAAQVTSVTTESGSSYEITPTAFTSAISGVDLVITRWFSHQ